MAAGGPDVLVARAVFARRHALVQEQVASLHRDGLVPEPWPSIAGLHAMLALHDDADAGATCERLGELGVLVEPTDQHWIGEPRPALSIGYGLAGEAALATAFDRIRTVLADAA